MIKLTKELVDYWSNFIGVNNKKALSKVMFSKEINLGDFEQLALDYTKQVDPDFMIKFNNEAKYTFIPLSADVKKSIAKATGLVSKDVLADYLGVSRKELDANINISKDFDLLFRYETAKKEITIADKNYNLAKKGRLGNINLFFTQLDKVKDEFDVSDNSINISFRN